MPENYELLEIGQIEIMHQQTHDKLEAGEDCGTLRIQHDSLAAELVKRGIEHNTEMLCSEPDTAAPNYRRGFTDDICETCVFGQLYPFCNLYKFNYLKDYTCDSFRYFEVLELEPPHGFLVAQEKQTAYATPELLEKDSLVRIIVSDGEAFGVAVFGDPAQIKTKEFDLEKWADQHRVTPRERRQWWPKAENFYVYSLKEWYPYEGIKLYKDGSIFDEPRLTPKQWRIVSTAKQLPKQIQLIPDAVSITDKQEFVIFPGANTGQLKDILAATFETDVKQPNKNWDELINLYSLALVRNPRMRVSKKKTSPVPGAQIDQLIVPVTERETESESAIANENTKQEEGDTMPFGIERRENEYCVINTETEETVACHETEEDAEAQLAALRINVEAEESEAGSDKPRKRKPAKKELVEIDINGEKLHMAVQTKEPDLESEKIKKAGFIESLRNTAKTISDFLKLTETEENRVKLFMNEAGIGQKIVNGELWHFTYSTNAFEDREGEIFSTQALERYVNNNELNDEKGYFNLWHINAEDGNFNTDFAKKEWQGVVGRFLVEAGPYLNDEKGQAAKEFFKKYGERHPDIAPEGWGCSPEFRYLPEERTTGTYETIWITRTSTLPKFAAANIWTETRQFNYGGQKMALNDEQHKAAVEIFGDDFVSQMTQEAEQKTQELEDAGIAHKDNDQKEDQPEENEPEVQQVNVDIETLAAEIGKQFQQDLTPVAEFMASISKDMETLKEKVQELEKDKAVKEQTETPRFIFNMQRASEQAETVVADDNKLKDQKPEEAKGSGKDPWGSLFNK